MEEYIEKLWLNFHKALLNFIKKKIANPEDAEDILQTVFLKIHTHIDKLKEKEKVVSWLYQITRNTIIDSYRTSVKNKAEIVSLTDNEAGAAENDDNNDEESWKNEIASFLVAMAGNLPEKYGSVFKMYELDRLTHQQIAERLGISVSGSKTRVQRSREKLKEILVCGCRSVVESNKDETANPPSACSHLVKIGQNNLCVKRMQGE